jgi:hypothetical protein
MWTGNIKVNQDPVSVLEFTACWPTNGRKWRLPYTQSQKCKEVKALTATPSHAEDIISYGLGVQRDKILIAALFNKIGKLADAVKYHLKFGTNLVWRIHFWR